MTVLYVASDAAKAGKTAFCASLAKLLSSQGKKTALLKVSPDGKADQDVQRYRQLLDKAVVAAESAANVKAGEQAAARLSQSEDVVIVEGLSRLDNGDSKEFAQAADAKVILLVGYRYDLKANDLASAKSVFGERLLGIVINGTTRYAGTQVRGTLVPSLESAGLRVLGTIPEDRRLLGFSVEQVREHLQGRYFGYIESKMQTNLVEDFMIGGNVLDWGVNYFSEQQNSSPVATGAASEVNTSGAINYFGTRKNKAVIVRGNRPDIQMAALNTSMSCLVATGGKEPLEYVVYEAEQEETPIVVVETDTLSTAKALENIGEKCAFDHPLKLDRFVELMQSSVDIVGVLSEIDGKN